MAAVRLDLCVLADVRAGDVAAPAHAAAIAVLARAGYRIGVLPVAPEAIRAEPWRLDPGHAALFESGHAVRLSARANVDCTLALAFDARLFAARPMPEGRIRSRHRLVTVERPAALVGPRLSLDRMEAAAASVLGGPPLWAPTTAIAREALVHAAPDWPLTEEDWPSVAPDLPVRPRAAGRSRPAIGSARISAVRPTLLDTGLPETPPRLLLWRLRGSSIPDWPRPAPLEVWPEDRIDMAGLLAQVDLLANPDEAADDPCPVEALLALRAGVVPCLPPEYRPVFGASALYGRLHDLPRRALDLDADRGLQAELAEAGRDLLAGTFAPGTCVARVQGMIGPPRRDSFAPAVHATPPSRVLFHSTNGVGMGHLTRQLAIARRLPERLRPVFLSHSQAVDVVRSFGFPAEHLPYHAASGQNRAHWNAHLAEALEAILAFWRPSALVFDGNVPFVGLLDALDRRPGIARIWIRRGLWGPNRDMDALERGRAFDLILEPGDPAAALDDGPTADRRAEVQDVAPVRLLDPAEIADRSTACADLGLDPANVNVLIAAGSGNNFDMGGIVRRALDLLVHRPGIGVCLATWMISRDRLDLPEGVASLAGYPFARSLDAFDFAIAAAGYNSFVEHLERGLPTIWTPNEHAEQDRQILRARFAAEAGAGLLVRSTEPFRLEAALRLMLDPDRRAAMRENGRPLAEALRAANGAEAAAAAIAGLCDSTIVRQCPTVLDAQASVSASPAGPAEVAAGVW
ncbi:antifreeze protein [Cereibacter sphaeroides]|uniref:glycosyltransferase n=1 Tax=Cereibacter sphaeroides TaxID=1063 RepID=UPI001F3D7FD3|nr:glycosyltransferase [Cereibacter sphaeroides]MCE6950785.1 antifreeze protein [Cereibacter sphaeroides]